jgi:hypothetical protein
MELINNRILVPERIIFERNILTVPVNHHKPLFQGVTGVLL